MFASICFIKNIFNPSIYSSISNTYYVIIGKGTSARDGAALAGALLEELDNRGCIGIFATHLHEIFELPLNLRDVVYRRMSIGISEKGFYYTDM